MRLDPESQLLGNISLFLFNFRIAEFHDAVALQADEMVVVFKIGRAHV